MQPSVDFATVEHWDKFYARLFASGQQTYEWYFSETVFLDALFTSVPELLSVKVYH